QERREINACSAHYSKRNFTRKSSGPSGRAAPSTRGGERVRSVRQLQTLPLADLWPFVSRSPSDVRRVRKGCPQIHGRTRGAHSDDWPEYRKCTTKANARSCQRPFGRSRSVHARNDRVSRC